MNVQTNIPLSTLTTMKLGGAANYVVEVTSPEELQQAYKDARADRQPTYIIGGGSNLIVHDQGFAGVIIHNKIPGIEIIADDDDTTTVRAGAGELWDNLVKFSVERNLSGIEAMSGIPGTVGAAPVQNIGAYGQELANTFVSLYAYDIADDQFVALALDDCQFAYRHSIFRGDAAGKYAITSVTLTLKKTVPTPPFYSSLQQYFDNNAITDYTVAAVRQGVLAIRSSKLPDPTLLPNAGSFFKNAIIDKQQADALLATYSTMPAYTVDDTRTKIPAGWLIEQCGLKGTITHGMKIHDANAVVLINESAHSYQDLADARTSIQAAVWDKFQIKIEQEPLELDPAAAR